MVNWKRNDPENFVFLFDSISIRDWGATIDVVASADTDGNNSYKVSFIGCRNIRWDMLEPNLGDLNSHPVSILGFDLGDEDYRREAILHGGFFEVAFCYEARQITEL